MHVQTLKSTSQYEILNLGDRSLSESNNDQLIANKWLHESLNGGD